LIIISSIWGQFHQHFTHFFRQYPFAEKSQKKSFAKHFCTKKPRVKCWWNWPRVGKASNGHKNQVKYGFCVFLTNQCVGKLIQVGSSCYISTSDPLSLSHTHIHTRALFHALFHALLNGTNFMHVTFFLSLTHTHTHVRKVWVLTICYIVLHLSVY